MADQTQTARLNLEIPDNHGVYRNLQLAIEFNIDPETGCLKATATVPGEFFHNGQSCEVTGWCKLRIRTLAISELIRNITHPTRRSILNDYYRDDLTKTS